MRVPHLKQANQEVPIKFISTRAFLDEHSKPSPGQMYVCRAPGGSMYPEVQNGDYLFSQWIEDINTIEFGHIYVIQLSSGIETVKYLLECPGDDQSLILRSVSKHIADQPMEKKYILNIFRVKNIFRNY